MSDTETQTTPLDIAIELLNPLIDKEMTARFGSPSKTFYEYDSEFFNCQVRGLVVRSQMPPSMIISPDLRKTAADIADALEKKFADTSAAFSATSLQVKLLKGMLEWEVGDVLTAPGDITLRHARSLVDTDVATVVNASNAFVPTEIPNKAVKPGQVKVKANALTSADMQAK